MRDKPEKPSNQNPADIAREAFRRLATRRIAPTPDAYRDIYNEITETVEPPAPDQVLDGFALFVTGLSGELTYFGQRLSAVEVFANPLYPEKFAQNVSLSYICFAFSGVMISVASMYFFSGLKLGSRSIRSPISMALSTANG